MAGRKKPHVSAKNHRGVTHIGANEAQGTAGSPDFSKAHVGSGFAWGIRQKTDKAVEKIPGVGKGNNKPRPGVWHPGAEKP
jgi:hypothetical protein